MTSPFTIAERVTEMHATRAAEPPSEAMGAFVRDQAELAATAPAGTGLPTEHDRHRDQPDESDFAHVAPSS